MGRAAAENEFDAELIHFLRGLLLFVDKCLKKHMVRARASVKKRRLTILQNLCSVDPKLYGVVSGHSVLSDGLLVGAIILLCNVFLFLWIDAALYGDSLASPVGIKILSARLLCFKNSSKNSPHHLIKL